MDKDSADILAWYGTNRRRNNTVADFLAAREGVYGDYQQYRDNLTALFGKLRATEAPVICFSEADDVANPHFPRPEIRPPMDAFLVQTEAGSGTLADTVKVTTSRPPYYYEEAQRPKILFQALQDSGVREVQVAGEYTFSLYNRYALACLGSTTRQLAEAGFRVRGISGAIFPSEDPNSIFSGPHWTRDAFYGAETVPLTEVN